VTVVRADIRTAQLQEQSFDLIHTRYVLIHLSDYEVALATMLNSLKPGGWLVTGGARFFSLPRHHWR
jgi:ubiquinone/menaquinone biosynthesis C-methylase UbiE